jgi:simple sugar transport system ATP-binding protein
MAAEPPFAIRLSHVSKVFGGVRALDDVSFDVRQGEVHCLAGENGCGKSTLIKIVTGVHAPEPGAGIEVFGRRVERMTTDAARRAGIAVIWQDLALFPEMSVAENIAFETLLGHGPRLVRQRRLRDSAQAALDRLGVSLDLGARLRTLPIAERQIVAIARRWCRTPASSSWTSPRPLSPRARRTSSWASSAICLQGVAVVFVSHRSRRCSTSASGDRCCATAARRRPSDPGHDRGPG